MKLKKDKQKEIIKKINDIYITNRQKYLVMKPNGEYITIQTSKQSKVKPLIDGFLKNHLNGNKATYGVFNGQYFGKFLCFDVDVRDKQYARWNAYKIIYALKEIGIPYEKIYPSISGNKGYHIEIFFKNLVQNDVLYELFIMTMEAAGLERESEYKYKCDGGYVEMRPISNQSGVKIPLGKHFKTIGHKRCWYVDRDSLQEIRSFEYILQIEQIENEILYNIIDKQKDLLEIDEQTANEIEESKAYIDEKYQPLSIYNQNVNEQDTIESIRKLEEEGLKEVGTRHNSLLKLAKYYKWQGMNEEDCRNHLQFWMAEQDTRTYRTKWEQCLKDIREIVKYIYENDVSLVVAKKEIAVTYSEMKWIIQAKRKNEQLILFSMLIHSKRFANAKGIFYMTQEQLANATGLDIRTIQNILPKLEQMGFIEYISRNQKQKGTYKKKANRYKLHIENEINANENTYTIQCNNLKYADSFNHCLISLFDIDYLKNNLSRRQFNELKKIIV
ncbi:helix-turn-helix domain-containing protein [Anoxybacillus sp. MB8]|uniref:helix-turn-helix domain-containing protein n=1 Tax=Anoxybacillus sp. MB8 TaxID=2496850 RepID=UPI0013D1C933|nr:helix-turn-helix domain-containing protein [Anoxybacillus sp. MB8]